MSHVCCLQIFDWHAGSLTELAFWEKKENMKKYEKLIFENLRTKNGDTKAEVPRATDVYEYIGGQKLHIKMCCCVIHELLIDVSCELSDSLSPGVAGNFFWELPLVPWLIL